ncbi:DUF2480 family protein [Haoranjiania flava]|uniref:DUF2480 family protein n=1 Tax=Haoranjiania flava TaxID=1856322 RepID=A0AAE3IKG4_9BACT|nr:DUF2480 family protein [Haoranjiania flava]MCU7693319.1 DUF2480 family protein [Haoranjiania flava]
MSNEIINRVAESGIITIDLEDFYPRHPIAALDIKQFLFMDMLLKEKDFRQHMKQFDWQQFTGVDVAVFCSTDAIIPRWAYMLIAINLQPVARSIFAGTKEAFAEKILLKNLEADLHAPDYIDKRVVVKGCGDKDVSAAAYTKITTMLLPYVKSLMYGEACSSVPLYKKK